MKAIRRIISLTAVIALAFSMASCTLLTKKANFTRKITVDNAAITIRDDMTEVDQIKNNDNYITGYKWSGYGLNVAKKAPTTPAQPNSTVNRGTTCSPQ